MAGTVAITSKQANPLLSITQYQQNAIPLSPLKTLVLRPNTPTRVNTGITPISKNGEVFFVSPLALSQSPVEIACGVVESSNDALHITMTNTQKEELIVKSDAVHGVLISLPAQTIAVKHTQ